MNVSANVVLHFIRESGCSASQKRRHYRCQKYKSHFDRAREKSFNRWRQWDFTRSTALVGVSSMLGSQGPSDRPEISACRNSDMGTCRIGSGPFVVGSYMASCNHSEARRISETRRLCRPRRSAARLQAGFRRSIGGVHWHATDRLTTVRSGCLTA
jgi:hypothetical protein